MNVLKLQRSVPGERDSSRIPAYTDLARLSRKFPQFQQNEIFTLSDAFQRLDVDDKGYLDEATAIKATQQSESQPYDVVRQALKEVELDSSRRVELEDYVGVSPLLAPRPPPSMLTTHLIAHRQTSRCVPSPAAPIHRTCPTCQWWCCLSTYWWARFQRKRERSNPGPGIQR